MINNMFNFCGLGCLNHCLTNVDFLRTDIRADMIDRSNSLKHLIHCLLGTHISSNNLLYAKPLNKLDLDIFMYQRPNCLFPFEQCTNNCLTCFTSCSSNKNHFFLSLRKICPYIFFIRMTHNGLFRRCAFSPRKLLNQS